MTWSGSYTHQAKETEYAGTLFRSRLEARWAAFFDALGWAWLYEPIDINGWIPDFRVSINGWVRLVEVKPCDSENTLYDVLVGPQVRGRRGAMVVGIAPLGLLMNESDWQGHWTAGFPLGLGLGSDAFENRPTGNPDGTVTADYVPLFKCRECGVFGPIGCWANDDHDNNSHSGLFNECVQDMWNAAGREVRYVHNGGRQ